MDTTLTLPSGEKLTGTGPIVVIGPNGSGKTRQTRNLSGGAPIEFINALRNTRVAPELPAMGVEAARNNFNSQKANSRSNHWELSSDFDYMLSQLLAQHSMAAIEFARLYKEDPRADLIAPDTPLQQVEQLWRSIFPGRELHWSDWKPLIKNDSSGATLEYTANQMSDGEKAALYLAARVFSTEPDILVVDEPETHLHSLLAVRLWNYLEEAKPDVRFVYVTHDLHFAMSRRNATYVLASPTAGLRAIDVSQSLPDDVVSALLGSASLSFHASRVVFCEGSSDSLDQPLYEAWFRGSDTVVKAVGSWKKVLRCVDAMTTAGVAAGLSATGLIDSDYHPAAFCAALPVGVNALRVHEVESLLALPSVVEAICHHVSTDVNLQLYGDALRGTINDEQERTVVIDRWKRRMEPHLEGLLSAADIRKTSLDDLAADLTNIFDHTGWGFSPENFLEEERQLVVEARRGGTVEDLVRVFPGKQMLPVAAQFAGVRPSAYVNLVCRGLQGVVSGELERGLETALTPYLPPRFAAAVTVPALELA